MKERRALLWTVSLLVLLGLACSQAGEILTPKEATARATGPTPTPRPTRDSSASSVQAVFEVGDAVNLVGSGAVVPLRSTAGASAALTFAPNNQPGTIAAVEELDGVIWYQVDSAAGIGWVVADFVKSAAGEQGDGETEATSGEPQPGDTVYLTASSFLINLRPEPGASGFIAVQERNVAVEILDVVDHEGNTWYLVNAPTGEGWVPAENISIETP